MTEEQLHQAAEVIARQLTAIFEKADRQITCDAFRDFDTTPDSKRIAVRVRERTGSRRMMTFTVIVTSDQPTFETAMRNAVWTKDRRIRP